MKVKISIDTIRISHKKVIEKSGCFWTKSISNNFDQTLNGISWSAPRFYIIWMLTPLLSADVYLRLNVVYSCRFSPPGLAGILSAVHSQGNKANSEGAGLRSEEFPQGMEQGPAAVRWINIQKLVINNWMWSDKASSNLVSMLSVV